MVQKNKSLLKVLALTAAIHMGVSVNLYGAPPRIGERFGSENERLVGGYLGMGQGIATKSPAVHQAERLKEIASKGGISDVKAFDAQIARAKEVAKLEEQLRTETKPGEREKISRELAQKQKEAEAEQAKLIKEHAGKLRSGLENVTGTAGKPDALKEYFVSRDKGYENLFGDGKKLSDQQKFEAMLSPKGLEFLKKVQDEFKRVSNPSSDIQAAREAAENAILNLYCHTCLSQKLEPGQEANLLNFFKSMLSPEAVATTGGGRARPGTVDHTATPGGTGNRGTGTEKKPGEGLTDAEKAMVTKAYADAVSVGDMELVKKFNEYFEGVEKSDKTTAALALKQLHELWEVALKEANGDVNAARNKMKEKLAKARPDLKDHVDEIIEALQKNQCPGASYFPPAK